MDPDSLWRELDGPRPLRPDADEAVAARRLDLLCFAGEEAAAGQVAVPYTLPGRGRLQVISHHGVPVCQAGIFHSRADLGGSRLHVGSVGGVCTHPRYRRLGLASHLLAYCARRLAAEGARLLLISGTRSLYTRAGCVPAGQIDGGRLQPNSPHEGTGAFTLRPAEATDAPLFARLNQMEAVHFVRQVEDFERHLHGKIDFPQAENWIAEFEGQPVAYLVAAVPWEYLGNPGAWAVIEYAGSRAALVSALDVVARRPGVRELSVFVPWQDHDLRYLLQRRGVAFERSPLPWHTQRILDWPGLLADLRPYLRQRLSRRQQRGLRAEQAEDRCALLFGDERIELGSGDMTRLVLGAPDRAPIPLPGGPLGQIVRALFPLPSFLVGLNYR